MFRGTRPSPRNWRAKCAPRGPRQSRLGVRHARHEWPNFPDLAPDFTLPPLFDSERLFSSILRVSSARLRVWTHYDVLDNVYVQVVGSKRAVLWAPDTALDMCKIERSGDM